jgi:hypothetical protein
MLQVAVYLFFSFLPAERLYAFVFSPDVCHVLRPSHFPSFIYFNLLNPTGHVMYQQFNIQQLYVLPTLYLCVLYLYENKQRLVPLTA